jgi:hypothetical protein
MPEAKEYTVEYNRKQHEIVGKSGGKGITNNSGM